ncbi:MAG TPA: HAD hydrolase-like protein [Kofleriaceae bacterium]
MPTAATDHAPSAATTRELLDRYAGVLLDVYGVLLDGSGALPGAKELISELNQRGTPYAIVTNDASRSIETYVHRFARFGLAIAGEHIVTSGSLLPGYFAEHLLAGARVCVLGTEDSMDWVRAAGGEVVLLERGLDLDVLAVCDDAGFEFLPGMEWAFSALVRAIEAGRRPTLVLPNPDLVYPKSAGELGFTAGSMALVIEAALARRFPGERFMFDRLGKPEPHLFVRAAQLLGIAPGQLVMIGDQLETDVAGARAAGCDAALLAGVSRWRDEHASDPESVVAPNWLLDKLWP